MIYNDSLEIPMQKAATKVLNAYSAGKISKEEFTKRNSMIEEVLNLFYHDKIEYREALKRLKNI